MRGPSKIEFGPMRPPGGRVVLLVIALLALCGAAAGTPPSVPGAVVVEVSADGDLLGRLSGEQQGRVTYFALEDVARLLGGRVRRTAHGRQATLAVPQGTLELTENQAGVKIRGRTVTLSAPVRVTRGRWLVPGDLLVRALPPLLEQGIRIGAVPAGASHAPVAAPAPSASGAPAAPAPAILRPSPTPTVTAANLTPAAVSGPHAAALADAVGPNPARAAAVGTPSAVPLPPTAPPSPPRPLTATTAPGPVAAIPPVTATPKGAGRETALQETGSREGGPREAPPRGTAPREGMPRDDGAELRYRSYPTYTRVVLEGDTGTEPRLVETSGGLVVMLPGFTHRGPPTSRAVRDGLVGGLELTSARGGATLRVTFDRIPAARKVSRLEDPSRLVLDFYRKTPSSSSAGSEGDGLRVIVLDPGHGGHDPGAVGPSGLQEKELTLDVARRVGALVQEEAGLRVLLTRTTDRFVGLRERTAFANREQADLFVSIHVNSAPAAGATGTETYFLSSEATDSAARQAAAAENRVVALEGSARGAPKDMLRSILWDLAQSGFQQQSSRLAEVVQNTLDRALRLPSRGVKQAPFYVLGGAAMPAVLVEIGFITNPMDEQRLRDDGYRDRIARAIAAALGDYKRQYDRRSGTIVKG